MRLDAIPIGEDPPNDINVIIEVPVGGEPIKYEMDKASGALVVDRFLYTSMRYPGNYGFVPHTLSDDGDPIDVLVATVICRRSPSIRLRISSSTTKIWRRASGLKCRAGATPPRPAL